MLLGAVLCAICGERAEFHAESNLVLVPVTVTDRGGAYLRELPRESFTLLDDRRPQAITVFHNEDAACVLGIVLDVSGSVTSRLERQKRAVRALAESLEPEDEAVLISVSSRAERRSEFGGPAAIVEAMRGLEAGGWTSLFDAIGLGLGEVRTRSTARRALVVVSDGLDNHSRTTRHELARAIEEADVQVYCLTVEETEVNRKSAALAEAQNGRVVLDEFARKSGGLSLRVAPGADPAPAARLIASAIHSQYVLGYRPQQSASGKWHAIRVKVDRRQSNVYARSGYREP